MSKKTGFTGSGLILFLCFSMFSVAYAQIDSPAQAQQSVITQEGRLVLEKQGKESEILVLHGKNAKAYLIKGELSAKLRSLFSELGTSNLVTLEGMLTKSSNLICLQSLERKLNSKGEYETTKKLRCVRYYDFDVQKIISSKASDEEVPQPKNDTDGERNFAVVSPSLIPGLSGLAGSTPQVVGQIWGKISVVNLKSPIKTVEITNLDKESSLEKITLILGAGTFIGKQLVGQDPIYISPQALAEGQEVNAMYVQDEVKSEALTITVTKE